MTMDAARTRSRLAPPTTKIKTERITVRVSVAQRELLSNASRTQSTTLTDFILDAATARAQDVLADRSVFSLEHEVFTAFVNLLDRPVVNKPRLRDRVAAPSLFDEE